MKQTITILICTRNRPSQIKTCLKSILANSFRNYTILIGDQSTNEETYRVVKALKSSQIQLVRMPWSGKTRGLNLLIKQAKSEILAFTDDDCLVDKHWLQQISNTYQRHPQVAGVFGNVFPYQPQHHLLGICPSIFQTKKFFLLTDKNLRNFLNGNNMSLKKSVLKKLGGFKEWLGVGSIGEAGEESELIFRILRNKLTLAVNPKVLAFHNKWLTFKQNRRLQIHYSCGFIASLSFYSLERDNKFAWSFIKFKISEQILPIFDQRFTSIKQVLRESYFLVLELLAVGKGISLGLLLAICQNF